jgi:hypothetical protein
MDLELPLRELKLTATSLADDLGFVALADVARLVARQELADHVRLIGGHMVTLHAQRWDLGRELYRETLDADLGIQKFAITQLDPLDALADLGYRRTSGNRFERRMEDTSEVTDRDKQHNAVIDVLVPTHTSRARTNIRVGDLATTEVPGLATAFQQPPVSLHLEMRRLGGEVLDADILVPDEMCMLILKALAWRTRSNPKDAVDIWRCLEIMHRAQACLPAVSGNEARSAAALVRREFATVDAAATVAMATYSNLNKATTRNRHTRIRALMKEVL